MIYVYHYKNDIEIIGRVMATGLDDARKKISVIKQLTEDLIDELFVIKRLDEYENNI